MVKVPGACPVPAEANRGVDQPAEQVGPGSYLHVQQYIEAAVTEFSAQFIHGAPTATLVEFDEFDMIEALQQTMLQFPDDPGDPGSGPVILLRVRTTAGCKCFQVDGLMTTKYSELTQTVGKSTIPANET